jgi:predicted CxxxxCH...CXXCH cytochrome family protein
VDCLECHNPHGSEGNLALIRRTILRNVITFTAQTGTDSFDEPDDDNRDDLCATCHTETKHNRVPSNRTEDRHFEGGKCTNCHAHDPDGQPVTVDGFMLNQDGCELCHGTPPPPANEDYPLDEQELPHPVHAGARSYGFDCLQCHDASNPNYAGHNTTPASFQDVWFDNFNPDGQYDPDTRTCGGVYCHSNGATARAVPGEPTYASAVWTDPESGACGTCHGTTEETLTTGIHPQHFFDAECSDCHISVDSMRRVEPNSPTHVNGQIEFTDGNTLPDTETCSRCHRRDAEELKQELLQAEVEP